MKTLNDICDEIINFDSRERICFKCRCGQDIDVRVPRILIESISFNCTCGTEYGFMGIDYD